MRKCEGTDAEYRQLEIPDFMPIAPKGHLPLLKWPGGKRDLVRHLVPLLPQSFKRYYEPFVGGGALFFAINPANAFLSDKNEDLINCYIQIRDNINEVISNLSSMKNTATDYYFIRDGSPTNDAQRAARLIYLSTLSFNGIHRVNLNGNFNVPYGHKTHLKPCDIPKLLATREALASVQLCCMDFQDAVSEAGDGDVVYLDPPYTVAHGVNGFVKYNAKIFSWEDQARLAQVALDLHRRGCRVVISNVDHASVKSLYQEFQVVTIQRTSRISASPQYRRQVTECIFHNGE